MLYRALVNSAPVTTFRRPQWWPDRLDAKIGLMSANSRRSKRKLLVLLGAGTSIPCGMPSVSDIDNKMRLWSPTWENRPEFPLGSIGEGIFNNLWRMIGEYYQRDPQPQRGIRLNYEKVLGEMIALASWVTPSPSGSALHQVVRDARPSSEFTWPAGRPEPFFYRHLIVEQLSFLLERLAAYMRQECRALDTTRSNFISYREMLATLRDEFDLGIYNLNYDNVALSAWPDAFTGFVNGEFSARRIADRGDWNFIYHLHGSVHYSLSGSMLRPSIKWNNDLSSEFKDTLPLGVNMASDFRTIMPTTLIAGGFKLDQLLSDPSQSLFASLVRHVHQADAFLIAGYGFADAHVNRALQNRFNVTSHNSRDRPPAIIVTKTNSTAGLIAERQGYEFFSWELTHTFGTRFSSMAALSRPRYSVPELVDRGMFELDPSNRTGVWHGGFIEAQGCLDLIRGFLRR